MKRKEGGYSLVELLIVLTVLAVLSAGIFVYIGFFKSIKLDAAANKLVADLRYAQGLAMSTTSWHGISFEANPVNIYSVYTTTGTADSIIEDPAHFGSNFAVNPMQEYETAISSVAIGGGTKVEFSPLGQPYTDKTGSAISSEGVITLTSGAYTKTIKITPNTGRIFIQ